MMSFKDSESYNYDRQNVHYRSEKEKKRKGLDVCDKATIKPVIVRDNPWEYRKQREFFIV